METIQNQYFVLASLNHASHTLQFHLSDHGSVPWSSNK